MENIVENLTVNPYFSAGFGLMGVTLSLALLRQGLGQSLFLLRRRLLVTLEIPSRDRSYGWFLQWMTHRSAKKRSWSPHLSVETSFKMHDNGSVLADFSLIPGRGKHLLRWGNAWFLVERQRDSRLMDLASGTPWETVTLTTLSRDKDTFAEMLQEAKRFALERQIGKTVIYTSYGHEWRPFGQPRKRRAFDSVVLEEGVAESILEDVKEFFSSGSWYSERGIPHRRGYLLHGPPGTGKTSFIQGLAGALEYDICLLSLTDRGLTDDRLNHLLSNTPARSIMLLEDIDAAFRKRNPSLPEGFQSHVTFSGLLNALDGVASSEGRVIFMTTNHPELLDAALIRPGRVDYKQFIGYATASQIRKMFLRFYGNKPDLANQLVAEIEEKQVSPAALQGLFVRFKNEPAEALKEVESLFSQ